MSAAARFLVGVVAVSFSLSLLGGEEGLISAANYPSIQAAVDANGGKAVWVPSGEFRIGAAIRISRNGTTLCGPGKIVQTNSQEAIIEMRGVTNVVIRELTLARPEENGDTPRTAIEVNESESVTIDGVSITENRCGSGAIRMGTSRYGRIQNCSILNYKLLTVDDRTGSALYGYAFKCIDGHGIVVRNCVGTMILNNRIVERRWLPTREAKEKHNLGALVEGRAPRKAGPLGKNVVQANYVPHWHQGSAIQVSGPENTELTQLRGNYIENSAQGIDLHCDRVICSQNTVRNGMMGIKAMHGSRHVILSENILSHVDLWGIMIGPGAASHAAEPASEGKEARRPNSDGSIIISGNIISDYGYGNEYWNWGGATKDQGGSYAIRVDKGQLESNPGITDVLIIGNLVIDSGKDGVIVDGKVEYPKPRFRYALHVEQAPEGNQKDRSYPKGLRVVNNIFDPGTGGVSNMTLP